MLEEKVLCRVNCIRKGINLVEIKKFNLVNLEKSIYVEGSL